MVTLLCVLFITGPGTVPMGVATILVWLGHGCMAPANIYSTGPTLQPSIFGVPSQGRKMPNDGVHGIGDKAHVTVASMREKLITSEGGVHIGKGLESDGPCIALESFRPPLGWFLCPSQSPGIVRTNFISILACKTLTWRTWLACES